MSYLPDKAISVRHPWAWAIVHAGKDVENRSAASIRHMSFAGVERLAIHAAQGMTRQEYEDAAAFMASLGVVCPPAAELSRGDRLRADRAHRVEARFAVVFRAARYIARRRGPLFVRSGGRMPRHFRLARGRVRPARAAGALDAAEGGGCGSADGSVRALEGLRRRP